MWALVVVAHGLSSGSSHALEHRINSCATWTQLLCGIWDPPRPGIEPMSPALMGFSGGSAGKESACDVGDLGLIPGLGRSPEEGNSYPLQYSGLENSVDSILHGVTKSQTLTLHSSLRHQGSPGKIFLKWSSSMQTMRYWFYICRSNTKCPVKLLLLLLLKVLSILWHKGRIKWITTQVVHREGKTHKSGIQLQLEKQ